MKFRQMIYTALLGLFISGLTPLTSQAIVLSGHFPMYQGRFWNYSTEGTSGLSTWSVNGNFLQRNKGEVFLLMQDKGNFMCMKDDWEGLTVYGKYSPDGYMLPEKPLLYLPREIHKDKPINCETTMHVFSLQSGKFTETKTIKHTVTFYLKSVEDMTIDSQEIRNCVILEKVIQEGRQVQKETLWLVPRIGPIKRAVTVNNKETVYTLESYAGPGVKQPQQFSTKSYFPLEPGLTWTYQSHDNKTGSIVTQDRVTVDGLETTPYVVNIPKAINPKDAFYYSHTDEGLVLPQIYRSAMSGCTVFYPPYPPVTVLPNTLDLGKRSSSTSYPRVCRWPSRTPNLDYFPEMQYASIPVAVEDVTVPAGTFKDCVKISLFLISRTYNFKMEKIRTGYIWLAKEKGIVKQEFINLRNYFLPERINEISATTLWDLTELKTTEQKN